MLAWSLPKCTEIKCFLFIFMIIGRVASPNDSSSKQAEHQQTCRTLIQTPLKALVSEFKRAVHATFFPLNDRFLNAEIPGHIMDQILSSISLGIFSGKFQFCS